MNDVNKVQGSQNVRLIIAAFLLLMPLTLPGDTISAQPGEVTPIDHARILIIFGPHYGIPTAEIFIPAITDSLKAEGIPGENIYMEFLDFLRFPDLVESGEVTALFTRKYSETPIDLIIPISQEAVDFVARDLANLFPGAPMLIPGFEAEPAWTGPKRPLIVLPTELDIAGTLRLAGDLFPAAHRLLVITGNDGYSRLFLEQIVTEAEQSSRFDEVGHIADLTYPQMLETVEDLPPETVAVFGTYFADSAGESFTPAAVAAKVAARSSVPVFGIRDVHVMSGLVGGSVIVSTRLGEQTAEIAMDYLTGTLELDGQDVALEAEHFPLFDWQELVRYGADPHTLPDTTMFLNRPETLWDTHRLTVITAGSAFLVLVVLTVLVVIQNRKLQVALRAQKQTEQQLTVTLNDKETLIRELYHRTNNNMQVIQGLLRSRMSAHPDLPLAEFVDDVIGQLQSMSQAQQQLFRGEHLSRIDLAEYLQSLVQVARDRYPDQRSRIAFLFHLKSVPILIDSAVPVGLVVYELVTNAVRHAFTGEPDEWESKEIDVTCDFTEADEIEIRISDNGLRWGPDPERTRSIGGGLGLATALVEQQLRGTIEFDDSVGTTCIVRFRDDQYEERV